MTDLQLLPMLEAYRSFETRVGEVMQAVCAPFCRVCKTPCCRVEICREAAESPFMQAVQNIPPLEKVPFDPKSGYLGCTGCKLKAGRPPICHAFVCSLIITRQPSDLHRYALECLGDLVTFIGSKVWLGRHLVETVTDRDLSAINLPRFKERLVTAEAAFTVLKSFFTRSTTLDEEALQLLALIRKPAF